MHGYAVVIIKQSIIPDTPQDNAGDAAAIIEQSDEYWFRIADDTYS